MMYLHTYFIKHEQWRDRADEENSAAERSDKGKGNN